MFSVTKGQVDLFLHLTKLLASCKPAAAKCQMKICLCSLPSYVAKQLSFSRPVLPVCFGNHFILLDGLVFFITR